VTKPAGVPVAAGLAGGVLMCLALGPSLVDPTNIEWLMHGDYALHFLGWHLYRHGPWAWPLGAAPHLIWPIGSSVGLTDSIPVAAIFFKLLDAVLPIEFQFIGLWLVLCVALQGAFGALLVRLATPDPRLQLVGAAFFVLSPPLVFRIQHAALTAHWVILAALWLSWHPDATRVSRRLGGAWALLSAVTAAIQPYLLVIVMAFALAAHARMAIAAPSRVPAATLSAVASVGAAALALWQAGSFMVRGDAGLTIGGFGGWSSNALSFVMPTEAGSFFSPGPIPYASDGQYEGYAYLGAGLLLLAPIAVATWLRRARGARTRLGLQHAPFGLALAGLTAMALGPFVTAGSRTLFTYDVGWWGPLTIFRTQGRMVWALYYTACAGILWAVCMMRSRRALATLIVALVVQAVDLAPMWGFVRDRQAYGFRDPLVSAFWRVVPPHYDRLILVPSNLCQGAGAVDYLAPSLVAARHGLAINAGITARYDVVRARAYCEALTAEVHAGLSMPGSLYVVRLDDLPRVAPLAAAGGAMCSVVDGHGVCFSATSYARWHDSFDLPRSRLAPADDLAGFHGDLDQVYRTRLGRSPRDAPAALAVRLEALARYLALRVEGCGHDEAAGRTLASAAGAPAIGLCGVPAVRHELPPADETFAFYQQLDSALRRRPGAVSTTYVDVEGEAVWLQAYLRERLAGMRDRDARAAVLARVR
jgi:hypothetical protein